MFDKYVKKIIKILLNDVENVRVIFFVKIALHVRYLTPTKCQLSILTPQPGKYLVCREKCWETSRPRVEKCVSLGYGGKRATAIYVALSALFRRQLCLVTVVSRSIRPRGYASQLGGGSSRRKWRSIESQRRRQRCVCPIYAEINESKREEKASKRSRHEETCLRCVSCAVNVRHHAGGCVVLRGTRFVIFGKRWGKCQFFTRLWRIFSRPELGFTTGWFHFTLNNWAIL